MRPNRPVSLLISNFEEAERYFPTGIVVSLDYKKLLSLVLIGGEVGRELENFPKICQIEKKMRRSKEIVR